MGSRGQPTLYLVGSGVCFFSPREDEEPLEGSAGRPHPVSSHLAAW